MKVVEHKLLVPGFGGDLGSSSRKAQCQGLVVLCLGAAWMAQGALCAVVLAACISPVQPQWHLCFPGAWGAILECSKEKLLCVILDYSVFGSVRTWCL